MGLSGQGSCTKTPVSGAPTESGRKGREASTWPGGAGSTRGAELRPLQASGLQPAALSDSLQGQTHQLPCSLP